MAIADQNHLDIDFDQETLKTRSVQGAAATFVVQVLKFLLRFGSIVLLARLLSPADFGLVAMVAPIVVLAQTLNELGLAQAIIQRPDVSARQVSGLFWLSLAFGSALALILVASAPLVGRIYNEPASAHILAVMAGLIVLGSVALVPAALLSRQMRFVSLSIIELLSASAGIITSIAAGWLGYGYWSLVYGQIATSILNVLLLFAVTRWRPSAPTRNAGIAPLARFGLALTGSNLSTYLMTSADNMIVGAFVGKTGLGLYDRSYALVVQPLSQIMSPVGKVAVPLLSRLIEDPELYLRTFVNMLKISVLLTAPGMIVAIIFAPSIVHYVLGENWSAAAPVFAWICVGGLAVPFFSAAGWIFVSHGKTEDQLAYSIAVSLISVTSFAIGVTWGIYGVAVVASISFTLVQTPIMIIGSSRAGMVGLGHFAKAMTPSVVAGLITGAGLFALPQNPDLISLSAILAVAYAIFGAVIYVLPGGKVLFETIARMISTLRKV